MKVNSVYQINKISLSYCCLGLETRENNTKKVAFNLHNVNLLGGSVGFYFTNDFLAPLYIC